MGAKYYWRPTTAPLCERYDDVWFVTPDVGWTVNSNGQILHTDNGGRRWEVQFFVHHEPVWLRSVCFNAPTSGWVGAAPTDDGSGRFRTSILYHTSDGATWSPVRGLPPEAPAKICGLWPANESVIYASGSAVVADGARIMKTEDGGKTWHARSLEAHASILIDVYFATPERGWVVGGIAAPGCPPATGEDDKRNIIPVVLYTEDGGRSWVDQVRHLRPRFVCGQWGWKIQRVDHRVLVVSLQSKSVGAILKSTDGGTSWELETVDDPQHNLDLQGIGFVNPRHGWVGGWGPLGSGGGGRTGATSATRNGGKSWRDANRVGKYINRFRFLRHPPAVGYASGETVYKYSDEPHAAPPPVEPVLLPDRCMEYGREIFIRYRVPPGTLRLTLFIWNEFGTLVRRLVDELEPTPSLRPLVALWDGHNDNHRPLPAGTYIYRLVAGEQVASKLVELAPPPHPA